MKSPSAIFERATIKGAAEAYLTSPATSHAARRSLKTSNREESDTYHSILVRLNSSWRVIACKDGIQWILQRRAGSRNGLPIWRSRSFCVTREGLLLCIREKCGPLSDQVMKIVLGLPLRVMRDAPMSSPTA